MWDTLKALILSLNLFVNYCLIIRLPSVFIVAVGDSCFGGALTGVQRPDGSAPFRRALTGMVWYGMVWYGMVWYGMVWYGMAQAALAQVGSSPSHLSLC